MVALAISREQVMAWLGDVADPEIPVLAITDLGIVRNVTIQDDVVVELTPTYSGCPATEVIEQSVLDALHRHGVENVTIKTRVVTPVDDRLDQRRGQGQAPGVRHCTAGEWWQQTGVVTRQSRRRVPALHFIEYGCRERVRLHGMQGIVQMQRLPRTVRILQVYLIDMSRLKPLLQFNPCCRSGFSTTVQSVL